MISLIIQQLYREILSVADENGITEGVIWNEPLPVKKAAKELK